MHRAVISILLVVAISSLGYARDGDTSESTPVQASHHDRKPEVEPATVPPTETRLMALGKAIFDTNCARCHGTGGEGMAAPQLAGNDRLRNAALVIRQIRAGGRSMPRFGGTLTDGQLAAVGTFVRNSWGNAFGVITQEDVANQRE